MNYYEYDKNNIAGALKKAINEKADPSAVKYLLDERNKKINTNPEVAHYKNDALTKAAEEYVNKYTGVENHVQRMYDARRDAAAMELELAGRRGEEVFLSGAEKVKNTFADARKDIYSAYRKNALSNEERLASAGLGRGINKAASSGFGESARLAKDTAYQNSIYESHRDEANAIGALASDYANSVYEADKKYAQSMADIADDTITRLDDNRDYLYKMERDRVEDNRNITTDEYENALGKLKLTGKVTDERQAEILGLKVGDTTADYENIVFSNDLDMLKFEFEMEQTAFENSLAEKEFESKQHQDLFERAYKLFAAAGSVVSEQMAQVLGVPVGTQYWQYVVAHKNAQNGATSAAASYKNAVTNAELGYLNYEVDKMNAETNYYNHETDRKKLTGEY